MPHGQSPGRGSRSPAWRLSTRWTRASFVERRLSRERRRAREQRRARERHRARGPQPAPPAQPALECRRARLRRWSCATPRDVHASAHARATCRAPTPPTASRGPQWPSHLQAGRSGKVHFLVHRRGGQRRLACSAHDIVTVQQSETHPAAPERATTANPDAGREGAALGVHIYEKRPGPRPAEAPPIAGYPCGQPFDQAGGQEADKDERDADGRGQ